MCSSDLLMIHGIMDTEFSSFMYPVMGQVADIPKEDFVKMAEIPLDALTALPAEHRKPLVISSFVTHADHATRTLLEHRIPHFDMPEKAGRAMAALCQHYRIRQRAEYVPPTAAEAPEEARKIFADLAGDAPDEFTAKSVLKAYSIPVTREYRVQTESEALDAARRIGFPVAVKVCSPDILHKTEEGMVFLSIDDAPALSRAFERIRAKLPDTPVLVSEMLRGDREFVAGISKFPGFPPCVMFGIGGVFTEALRDIAIRLAPLTRPEAGELMNAIEARDLLGAFRGMPAVDTSALGELLMNLGRLALDFPRIREIDLNPIMIVEGRPKVVDALFVMK